MAKDLYATLGVSRSAPADEIRRVYKRKVKELHPDLHPGDTAKADAFKQVSAAYEILGDETRRRQYDRGEIDEQGAPRGFARAGPGGAGPGGRPGGFSHSGSFQGDPFEDILSGMFGGGRRRPGPQKGGDIRYQVEVAFEDAALGAKREMTMADGRVLNVSIPAGVETGQTLRLKSQGRPSPSGGPPGDALLELIVRQSKVWIRDGDDLRMNVPVPLSIAVLGGSIEVATPTGPITLKIPEGSNSGAVLRLRHKGIQRKGAPGHLYVRLEIMIDHPKDPDLRKWAKSVRK